MIAIEKKSAKKEKALISKSMPKSVQGRLKYLIGDIILDPRDKNALGNPEELKHYNEEVWSRELTKKDRIVYGIESGKNYGMPEENEIIVFYQYLGHYADK
jgi:toxin YoeB